MKNKDIYIQNICANCLQLLVNDESDHSETELKQFKETIDNWSKDNYYQLAPNYDKENNLEPGFSWSKCDICDSLPGDRYEYNFYKEEPMDDICPNPQDIIDEQYQY